MTHQETAAYLFTLATCIPAMSFAYAYSIALAASLDGVRK